MCRHKRKQRRERERRQKRTHCDVLAQAGAEAAAGDLPNLLPVRRQQLRVPARRSAGRDEPHALARGARGELLLDDLAADKVKRLPAALPCVGKQTQTRRDNTSHIFASLERSSTYPPLQLRSRAPHHAEAPLSLRTDRPCEPRLNGGDVLREVVAVKAETGLEAEAVAGAEACGGGGEER